jgi:hypothetical protein
MNKKIFDIDWATVVRWMIPFDLRKTELYIWVKALLSPVVTLWQKLLQYRKEKAYDLMITGQVCYLEQLLNDKFDSALKRIYIADVAEYPPVYLYQRLELKPVYLFRRQEMKPVLLYTRNEGALYADDFIIMVPYDVFFNEKQMRGMVQRKRLPGMRFKIQKF